MNESMWHTRFSVSDGSLLVSSKELLESHVVLAIQCGFVTSFYIVNSGVW